MKAKKHEEWRKGFPYFKVQYWDTKVTAWHDVQKHFKSEAGAKTYGHDKLTWKGFKWRIMRLDREGRKVL